MATIKDIAEELGITPTAVSYALNGRVGKVSATTRQRVLDTAQAMGYQPHSAARALKTGRTDTVAVLIRTPQSPYYAEVLHHIVQQVLAHQYKVLIERLEWPEAVDWTLTSTHGGVDGLFVVDAPPIATALRNARSNARPTISLGTFYAQDGDYVGVDLLPGAKAAVTHLMDIGCRRVACLIDAATHSANDPRQVAYEEVIHGVGQRPEFLLPPVQMRPEVYHFVREYVTEHGCPDGLFCLNDEMAIGAHRALRDLGRHVPEDVALVGCDGIQEAEYSNPPLTTIIQPIEEMCALAWQFLENRIADPSLPPQQAVLPAHLVIRESTRR